MSSATTVRRPESQFPEVQSAFDMWAGVYDEQPNPLLSLEERLLAEFLPDVRDLVVADIGCGTGRWLERLADHGARQLIGIDPSPGMCARAQQKLGARALISQGEARALPLAGHSADLVLASFMASYVADLDAFAGELSRVAREGCQIFFSDVHPGTAAACRWKRNFRSNVGWVEVNSYQRSLEETIAVLERNGFEAVSVIEPAFGAPEARSFAMTQKSGAFASAAGLPAIYILQLRRRRPGRAKSHAGGMRTPFLLQGARVAFGPNQSTVADLITDEAEIAALGASHRFPGRLSVRHHAGVDLSGYLLLPGLINSHDHLEFGLYSNLGHGPYNNANEWAADIHARDAAEIARQRKVPRDVRIWWGALRNLLCGVTTVCHHNPVTPEITATDFPVRVLTDFGWAHSLALDSDIRNKFEATDAAQPFVLHAAEGLDDASANEIGELDQLGMLDDRTVLVHGLALSQEGAQLLNRRGAALVWCPTSNRFLFGRTHSREFLASLRHVALGSDSPLTAGGDLLDEVGVASDSGISAEEIYDMVYTRPAKIFRVPDQRGEIRPHAAADLIAVRDTSEPPAARLANLSSSDVELVMVAGRIHLASDKLLAKLPTDATSGLEALEVDGERVWVRAPRERLFRETAAVLGSEIRLGRKRVKHVDRARL